MKQTWGLSRLWALFLLMLFGVTYPLWLPAFWLPLGTSTAMPRVAWFDLPVDHSRWIATVPSITAVIGLLLAAARPIRYRNAWWLVAASLLVCFLTDQHRLQPWAYQSAIYATVFASMDSRRARKWLIPMAASVYLYSAAGKFDYQFSHTVGQDFLTSIAKPFGGIPDDLGESTRLKLAFLFPAMESFAGLCLLFQRTRRFGGTLIIAMHLSLIVILSPVGLDHSTGVLVWNALLIVQAYYLMLRPASTTVLTYVPSSTSGAGSRLSLALVVIALVAPLTERWGYWDHWTSWSLYSPHTSRVDIDVHGSALRSLDAELQSFFDEDKDGDGWRPLAIERWSLSDRRVPIYPQSRYQLAFAAEFAKRHQFRSEIRARLRGTSDRWTGRRAERRMLGLKEIERGLESFWLTP